MAVQLERINFTTPPGRLVAGSLYVPNTTDAEGRPLVVKNGPNTGQPRVEYFIALAIAKGAERHWAETPWGQKIWMAGHQFLAHAGQLGDQFAWKVKDGDSQVPSKGKDKKRPCDREGYPGHWVLHMSGGYQPEAHTLIGTDGRNPVALTQPDAINPGDYVQVNLDVVGNGASQQPGVYLNPGMVCLLGYGKRIRTGSGPTAEGAGFGGVALPAGAMATPPGGFNPAPQTPALPGPPGYPPAPGAAPAMSPPIPGPAYSAAGAPPVGYPIPGPQYAPPGLPQQPPPYAGAPAMVGHLPQQPQYAPPGAPGAAPGYTPPPQYAAPAALPPGPGSYPPPPGTMTSPSSLPPQNPAFLQPPAPPAQRVMTAKAQGAPYEAFASQGWTDAMLVQQGYMLA